MSNIKYTGGTQSKQTNESCNNCDFRDHIFYHILGFKPLLLCGTTRNENKSTAGAFNFFLQTLNFFSSDGSIQQVLDFKYGTSAPSLKILQYRTKLRPINAGQRGPTGVLTWLWGGCCCSFLRLLLMILWYLTLLLARKRISSLRINTATLFSQ